MFIASLMSWTGRRNEDKRRKNSSLGDLAREVFGVPRPRESQGSDRDVGGSEEGGHYPHRRGALTMRDRIYLFIFAVTFTLFSVIGAELALHAPTILIIVSIPLFIALDAIAVFFDEEKT